MKKSIHTEEQILFALRASGISVGPAFWNCAIASVPLNIQPWRHLADGELMAVTSGQVLATSIPPLPHNS